jgi:hypothetical protein
MSLIHVQKQNSIQYFIALSLITFLLVGPLSSVKAADTDVSKETKEALTAIGEYSVEQKDAAVKKAKEMMDSLDARINKLEGEAEARWGDLKDSSKEKYQTSLAALRKQRNELSEWYGSMKHSSKSAWNEVKAGFSKSYDTLVQSWQDAEKEIDKEM